MRKFVLFVGLLCLMVMNGPMASGDELVWHQEFSADQIEAMQGARAIIHTAYGDIRLKFFPEVAPNHVYNFIQLSRIGFYNKTLFHRVVPGFVIQGGDPESRKTSMTTWGTGGPGYGYRLKAEFNGKSHIRGRLSMARASYSVDSAGSQFFICLDNRLDLDGDYTVFGEVEDGMIAVVDEIAKIPTTQDGKYFALERVEMTVEVTFAAGDVTGEGKLDLREAIRIMQAVAGIRPE